MNLLRFRDGAGNSIGYLFVTATGKLGFHADAANTNTSSTVIPGAGWHALELHVNVTTGTVEVWLDGAPVPALGATNANLGVAPVGILQIGESQTGQTYDVVYDDAAFGASRLGPSGDTSPPTTPGAPTAVATSPFSVQVDWTAATDDVGVTGYDVFRDGSLFSSLGAVTTFTDSKAKPAALLPKASSLPLTVRDVFSDRPNIHGTPDGEMSCCTLKSADALACSTNVAPPAESFQVAPSDDGPMDASPTRAAAAGMAQSHTHTIHTAQRRTFTSLELR